jgi:hypothetical protein
VEDQLTNDVFLWTLRSAFQSSLIGHLLPYLGHPSSVRLAKSSLLGQKYIVLSFNGRQYNWVFLITTVSFTIIGVDFSQHYTVSFTIIGVDFSQHYKLLVDPMKVKLLVDPAANCLVDAKHYGTI